jgi:2,3-bisphosphoglycerate-independent phosphoglycerate mutase
MRQCNVLCILDGVGWGRRDEMDAVYLAKTPTLDQLQKQFSWRLLQAHGTAVGMPSDADMGNSEVGHNAMGAGRVFAQGAKLVQTAIAEGTIWQSEAWKKATKGQTLHLLGLLSDGNVHSHIEHLLAMIQRAEQDGVRSLRVHILTDGRDVSPRSALEYIQILENQLSNAPQDYKIGTGGGRMYCTMDRYQADWQMVRRGWDCHVHGLGQRFSSAAEAIEYFYAQDQKLDDQWIPTFVIDDYQGIQDGDSILFFNFRGDRAIEISRAFVEGESFDQNCFDRRQIPKDLFFAGMMEYDGDLKIPEHYLVPPPEISDTVGIRLAEAGLKVFSISETQKFGHVTFFFNGNRSGALKGETQMEVPSFNVPFDQKPAMSAPELAKQVSKAIRSQKYDHIRVNFANGDMVGHTGKLDATIKSVEIVDQSVAEVWKACQESNSVLLITADHGNADQMAQWDKKTQSYKKDKHGNIIPSTAHSTNPVPLILCDPQNQYTLIGSEAKIIGGLAQIGGTLLALSGLEVPKHYLPSLIKKDS